MRESYKVCIPEIFNTNISHKFLSYKINFLNSQHKKTNSKGDLKLKNRINLFFKDFWHTKIYLTHVWHDEFN